MFDSVSKLGAVAHVYGRCTGDGHPDRGGRVVELTEGDYGFRTWIREWDGDVVQEYIRRYGIAPEICVKLGTVCGQCQGIPVLTPVLRHKETMCRDKSAPLNIPRINSCAEHAYIGKAHGQRCAQYDYPPVLQ